jgi:hypothetical protein
MEQVFTALYEHNYWGNNQHPEYRGSSGGGSDVDYNKNTYVPFLKQFIKERHIKTVVDLGCGDFRCGPLIYGDLDITYTGYDAYKKVVDYHNTQYSLPKYTFIHLDFCNQKETIQCGDLCILKDVIQHWSLNNIYTFLDYLVKDRKFKYILLCNCCNQTNDNTNILNGDWRPLSSQHLPLRKYNPVQLYHYDTKEVSVIEIKPSYPKVIYFCNHLIGEKEIASANNWKNLNPDYEIKLYDDAMIRAFLLEEYGEIYVDLFNYLQDGPIKADFWRVCILYKYGGVYSDIDNMPLVSLSDFIEPNIDFVTCSSYINHNYNPNFIISYKDCVILKRCMDWYLNKYKNRDVYQYNNWSIMNAFTDALHLEHYNKNWGMYKSENMMVQIIHERPGQHHYDAHNVYKNMRVFNNRQPGWNVHLHRFN